MGTQEFMQAKCFPEHIQHTAVHYCGHLYFCSCLFWPRNYYHNLCSMPKSITVHKALFRSSEVKPTCAYLVLAHYGRCSPDKLQWIRRFIDPSIDITLVWIGCFLGTDSVGTTIGGYSLQLSLLDVEALLQFTLDGQKWHSVHEALFRKTTKTSLADTEKWPLICFEVGLRASG